MIINCGSCKMRDLACGDCVVSFLLDNPTPEKSTIGANEAIALEVLAEGGLVPPLRFVGAS
jgi:hypothetical protein